MKDRRDKERTEDGRYRSPHLIKIAQKLINTGAEAVHITREELRTLVELNPREAVGVMLETVLKSTDQLQTILVREAQRYLNAIDLRDELGKVLSNYTIEVNASINFVPREKASGRGILRRKGGQDENAKVETEAFKVTFVPKNEEAGEEPDKEDSSE